MKRQAKRHLKRVGVLRLIRSKGPLQLLVGAKDPARLTAILKRRPGIGAADPAAAYDVVRAVAVERGIIEWRRRVFGDRREGEKTLNLNARRARALEALDAAMTAVRAALCLADAEDLALFNALAGLQPALRAQSGRNIARTKRGRAGIQGKADLLGQLRALGATARDARYLMAHLPPADVTSKSN